MLLIEHAEDWITERNYVSDKSIQLAIRNALFAAIAFCGIPLILPLSRLHAIVGVGACVTVLSKFMDDWIVFGMIQTVLPFVIAAITMSFPASGNPSLPGAGFGAGAGFYFFLIGFALQFYSYARRTT